MAAFKVNTNEGPMIVEAANAATAEKLVRALGYTVVKRWVEATFREAVEHAQGRLLAQDSLDDHPPGICQDFDVLCFIDGTAIAVRSSWSGPLSDATPDIDASDPVWKVYQ